MMRFMHSHRSGSSLARVAPQGAAILIAAFAGGCSAEITRFDFPGFSLTDDKKDQTSSLQKTASADRGPSYLGNERNSSASGSYDRGGYVAPRSYGENGVKVADLPDASPSPPPSYSYSYADDRRRAAQPPRQSAPPLRPGESVEIRPGDTLYGLSRRHHVSVAELMEVNGLNNPNLHPGQKIYLPEGYSAQPRQMAAAQTHVSVPPPSTSKFDGSYTMRNGDSLYGLSRSYGVPLTELQRVNGITDPRSVRVGTVLRVPGATNGTHVASIAEPPARVAEAPQVIQSTHQPTVINRRETQVAARTDDVSTGTINPPPRSASATDKLRWPVHGKIITGFGQRNDGTHNDGINLAVPQGTAVHAAEAGSVAYAGSELKGYGNLILVRHDNGWVTAYAHNEQLLVKRGDKVQRGQVIAKAGRTGSVDQPQVHFELRQGSKPVDPVPFLDRL
jgi:murein DD-endopeptidase MepM/ murein hydrolase activator NlpD